jgi:hypothetical protein
MQATTGKKRKRGAEFSAPFGSTGGGADRDRTDDLVCARVISRQALSFYIEDPGSSREIK